MTDLQKSDNLEEELGIPAEQLKSINILFLDPSSTCTGYTVASVNFEDKKAKILSAGAIWLDKHLPNQEKYHYLYNAITNFFNIVYHIGFCFAEAYMLNTNKKMGCLIGPEIHGAIQVALAEIGVGYKTIPVQTWRSQMGIKPDPIVNKDGSYKTNSKGKVQRNFKSPTRRALWKYLKLPEKIISNITHAERKLPDDLTDALAICIGTLKKYGIEEFDFEEIKIQEDFSIMSGS